MVIVAYAATGLVGGRVEYPRLRRFVTLYEWAALLLAIAASGYALADLDSLGIIAAPSQGDPRALSPLRVLLEHEGVAGVVVLAGPVVAAGLPFLMRTPAARQRIRAVSAVILVVFATGGALSVGLLQAPSALALVAAAWLGRRVPAC